MIPKRFIYTWFGNKPLPDEFVRFKSSWKENNPDFEFLEINESNFNLQEFAFASQAYQAGKMPFVSDVARIWAVNKFGGIYLDIDVEVLKSLEPLLKFHQFWAKEDAGLVASGLVFGSESNDKILQEILNYYSRLQFNENKLPSLSTVQIISTILKKYGLRNNRRTNRLTNGGIVFPPQYFAPLHYWGGGKVTHESFTVHHYKQQPVWTTKKNTKINYLLHETMYWVPLWGVFLRWLKKTKVKKSH